MSSIMNNNIENVRVDSFSNDNTAPQIIDFPDGTTVLKPDLNEARQYLSLLAPGTKKFSFQTFDDTKSGTSNLVDQVHASVDDAENDLIALNRQGAGIYVTVQETDLTGRKSENITKIRAVYADFDDGLPENVPLPPSITIQSSPGKYQFYWLCDGLDKDDFASVMDRLVRDYGADHRAKDLARVLRVPGFYHQKGRPVRVKLLPSTGQFYTREEILAALLPIPGASGQ